MGITACVWCFASGINSYYINGVYQPIDGSDHFALSDNDYIYFEPTDSYQYGIREETRGTGRDSTYTAPIITVNKFRNTGTVYFNGDVSFSGDFLAAGYTGINGNATISSSMNMIGGTLHIENGSLNTDNATWNANYTETIEFGTNASINITTSSNGKTLLKCSTITGTVTIDVDSGVQEGYTFSIEATDNQLVITDGEWTATPSTVGNVTTYTLTKAGPSKKFRLFYTVDGGNRTLRLLGGIV